MKPILDEQGVEAWALDLLGNGFCASGLEGRPNAELGPEQRRQHLHAFWKQRVTASADGHVTLSVNAGPLLLHCPDLAWLRLSQMPACCNDGTSVESLCGQSLIVQIGRPVAVVGTSLGGAVAIDFANAHPEAVGQLVLLAPQVQEFELLVWDALCYKQATLCLSAKGLNTDSHQQLFVGT